MPNAYLQEEKNVSPRSNEEFQILRSVPENYFSEILFLATQTLDAPAAGIVVCENEDFWVKDAINISHNQILSFKEYLKETIEFQEVQEVHLRVDHSEKFEYPSFIGQPLQTLAGVKLGVLCVFHESKKELSREGQKALYILANQVVRFVEFGKQKNEFGRVQSALKQKYQDLEKFASVVSHDIKSPLANIISLTELLKEENKNVLTGETLQYLDFLEESSLSLRNYVDGLLKFYRSEKILQAEEEDVELQPFFQEITKLYTVDPSVEISFPSQGVLKKVNKAALSQIFFNLMTNALKYNFKDHRQVNIAFEPSEAFYEFQVKDNGNGIPLNQQERIFELFTTLEQNDRNGNPGSGIGLTTVKKLVESMGGEITVESKEDYGSNFKFKIKR